MYPDSVSYICKTLSSAGFEAWLVGGAVRDVIIGKTPHDWDIATNAKPEEVIKLFPRVIETGLQHGTVTVFVDLFGFEVTTFRGDGEYSDGRHPDEVMFCSTIEEDLSRRDFTVNAIAYNPITNKFCDPFNGIGDIENKTLRTVGDPNKRFNEDGLRLLRAIRFSSVLGFEIEQETLTAITSNVSKISNVSIERVRDEFFKIMSSPKPSIAFNHLQNTGMLDIILPEVIPMISCEQNKYHAYDVWVHTLTAIDSLDENDIILRFAALFHDVGKPESKGVNQITGQATFYDHENIGADLTYNILNRLKFSSEDRDRIVHLVKHHFIRYEKNHAASAVRRWVRKVGLDNVSDLCKLARADIEGKGPAKELLDVEVIDHLENRVANMKINEVIPTSIKILVIDGKDVMDVLNISPGPMVGKILNALLEMVTDYPEYNNREKLLQLTEEIYNDQD